jgi:hypothetical protein
LRRLRQSVARSAPALSRLTKRDLAVAFPDWDHAAAALVLGGTRCAPGAESRGPPVQI